MRNISRIIIHCSATMQDVKIESIKNYWRLQLGWKKVGYHLIIEKSGNYTQLLNFSEVSNGAKGFNHDSIHICYIGGITAFGKPIDNRTQAQKDVFIKLIKEISLKYDIKDIRGHYQLPNVNKFCPCFDALAEYKYILAKSLI